MIGDGPITHCELRAWQENTGIELQPWEARTLRSLSNDYLFESIAARKYDRAAPWSDDAMTQDNREAIAMKIRSVMRSRMGGG